VQKIEVVLRSDCLQAVTEALRNAKISPLQASDVTLFYPDRAPDGRYRGAVYSVGRERVKVELLLPDHDIAFAIEAIRQGIDPCSGSEAELLVLDVRNVVHLGTPRWERPAQAIG